METPSGTITWKNDILSYLLKKNAKSVVDRITYTKDIQHKIKDIRTKPKAEINSNHKPVIVNIRTTELEKEKKYNKIKIYKLREKEIDNTLIKMDKTKDR